MTILPRRILVTGGNGFIGRRVVARLRAAGCRVTVVDDGSSGLPPPPSGPGLEIVPADIRDAGLVEAAMMRVLPDAVLHLAALHHVPTCRAEPRRAVEINMVGTQSVLDAAAMAGVGLAVIASSGAVYDWIDGPLGEASPTRPADIYALTKLANEQQLALWADRGRRGRVARLFNVIGPGDPNGHLIPEVMDRIAAAPRGRTVEVSVGHLDHRRDYIHVEDAAEGLIALLADPDPVAYSIDNLCSGRELGVGDLVALLGAALGIELRCVSAPALRRSDDRPSQLGAPERARDRLGWRARRPVEAALAAIAAADGRFAHAP